MPYCLKIIPAESQGICACLSALKMPWVLVAVFQHSRCRGEGNKKEETHDHDDDDDDDVDVDGDEINVDSDADGGEKIDLLLLMMIMMMLTPILTLMVIRTMMLLLMLMTLMKLVITTMLLVIPLSTRQSSVSFQLHGWGRAGNMLLFWKYILCSIISIVPRPLEFVLHNCGICLVLAMIGMLP